MSPHPRPCGRQRRWIACMVCAALLLDGLAAAVLHAAPAAAARLAAVAQICSAAAFGAQEHADGADVAPVPDDTGSAARATHCALCLLHGDPVGLHRMPALRAPALARAAGTVLLARARPPAAPHHPRARPRAPPQAT